MPEPRPLVLVVEDDPLILIHSRLALEDAGYVAVPVRDAGEALDRLAERNDIRALFTDVRMPGALDGLALARRVSAERPEVRIIVTSGSRDVDPTALPRGARFLPKPYTVFEVTRALAGLPDRAIRSDSDAMIDQRPGALSRC